MSCPQEEVAIAIKATDSRSLADRRIWAIIAIACVIPAILGVLQQYLQGKVGGRASDWQDAVFQGAEWLILGGLTPIAYLLGQRFPINRSSWKRDVAIHAGGSLLLCFGWATLGIVVAASLHVYPVYASIRTSYLSWLLVSLPYSVFMYFAVLGCVYAYSYFIEARNRETQAATLAGQLSEARLRALRMQLNPHFLFNSLNALSVLVREHNTEDATKVLDLLSEVLRQVLRSDTKQLAPLWREVEFLKRYLSIEEIRFSDRLRVVWRIDDRVHDAMIPTFLLQPVVENAVRHGIARRADSGLIEIEASLEAGRLVLIVRDDGAGPGGAPIHEGVGLSNTRERLSTLYGEHATVRLQNTVDHKTEVVVKLPFSTEVS